MLTARWQIYPVGRRLPWVWRLIGREQKTLGGWHSPRLTGWRPMSYSLATLWFERARYFPGVLAVGFSALLIALQGGLLLGLFSITSIPIDMSHADIWVGHPEVPSVDLGRPIPESWQ